MFNRILEETRAILVNLEKRYDIFLQQQKCFVQALDRCRKFKSDSGKIKTIAEVSDYVNHLSENRVDTRVCKIFLSLVYDLNDFRRTIEKLSEPTNDETLEYLFATWKKVLEPRQDISNLRERHPWKQLNQLSCAESQVYFGGIVSVLPIAIDCAKSAYKRLRAIRAYREQANEYHFVENLKIQKDREADERYHASLYKKKNLNSPIPAKPHVSKSRLNKQATKKVDFPPSKTSSNATLPQVIPRAISGRGSVDSPATKEGRISAISSPTASTQSTESRVMNHLKNTLLNSRDIPTHGIDNRPRGDSVATAFQWHDRKQLDVDSVDFDEDLKKCR